MERPIRRPYAHDQHPNNRPRNPGNPLSRDTKSLPFANSLRWTRRPTRRRGCCPRNSLPPSDLAISYHRAPRFFALRHQGRRKRQKGDQLAFTPRWADHLFGPEDRSGRQSWGKYFLSIFFIYFFMEYRMFSVWRLPVAAGMGIHLTIKHPTKQR